MIELSQLLDIIGRKRPMLIDEHDVIVMESLKVGAKSRYVMLVKIQRCEHYHNGTQHESCGKHGEDTVLRLEALGDTGKQDACDTSP